MNTPNGKLLPKLRYLAALVCLFIASRRAANCSFGLIDVQFGTTSATTKTGYAATGNSSSDIWNLLDNDFGGDSGVTLTNCVDYLGNPTTVSVSANSDESGSLYDYSGDPLYSGWMTSSGGNDWQISVSVPTGTYDFYFYAYYPYEGGLGTCFSITSRIVGATCYSSYEACTSGGDPYIVFSCIPVAGCTPIVFNLDSYPQVFANGMQIDR